MSSFGISQAHEICYEHARVHRLNRRSDVDSIDTPTVRANILRPTSLIV